MEPGGSLGFAGLPDFCPETCLRLGGWAHALGGGGAAPQLRVVALMMLCGFGLQTDFRFGVILGMPRVLAFELLCLSGV